MSSPVRDLARLDALLRELPPPAEGMGRVFRGQTADFPAMLPSGCRPGVPAIPKIWKIALLTLRDSRMGIVETDSSMDTIMNIGFWFDVLAQHYGPGSPYLDVTSSPEVALWFALNHAHTGGSEAEFAIDQPGLGPVALKCTALTFSEHRDDVGWFYVLDVPCWDGKSIPGHGEFVNLAEGPDFVANCPRVARQQGGLVPGDIDVRGGDLSGFYACPPIAVAREFSGAPFVDLEPEHLFPGPDEDEWYGRLLQAPLTPQATSVRGFEYKQSLGIYMVTKDDVRKDVLGALKPQVERMSPLVRGSLRAIPDQRLFLRDAMGEDPETATYLQIEIPLLSGLPSPNQWNQSALFAGLGRRIQPREEATHERLPALSLDHVLIELSPLEHAFKDLDPDAVPIEAVWLIRRGCGFRFAVFGHTRRDHALVPSEIHEIMFSEATGGFELCSDSDPVPVLESGLSGSELKAFFIALEILRGLSSIVKPDAYVSFIADGTRFMLPMRGASTVLTRSREDPADVRLHFLRYADSFEPYVGPTLEMPAVGLLEFETAVPYESMPSLRHIYGHAKAANIEGVELELPGSSGDGFCAETAETLLELFPDEGESRERRGPS